jgi:hypothetical protein
MGASTGVATINNPTLSMPNSTQITTNQTTFSLINSGAQTINFGGSASIINVGATTGVNILPSANTVSNLGSSTLWFQNVYGQNFYGTSTSAQYADLAEKYVADDEYKPGTVVVFGGKEEITVSDISHDTRVAGIISTNPAYLMNSGIDGLAVAFTGRVPCYVQGPVKKGDRLVNLKNGIAGKLDSNLYEPGCIIGKSVDDINTSNIQLIEVAVGRY